MSLEDQKQMLEQVRREAREIKAQEAQMKWNMKREEERQKKTEKKDDAQEMLEWRRQQQDEMLALQAQRKKATQCAELQERRDYQEHKRDQKAMHKEEELQRVTEEYLETKENAEYRVEMHKMMMAERPKPGIEANLENFRALAEYNQAEQQREDQERADQRMAAEQAALEHKMMQARRERDLALQSLEITRSGQATEVPSGRHLSARPK